MLTDHREADASLLLFQNRFWNLNSLLPLCNLCSLCSSKIYIYIYTFCCILVSKVANCYLLCFSFYLPMFCPKSLSVYFYNTKALQRYEYQISAAGKSTTFYFKRRCSFDARLLPEHLYRLLLP